MSVPGHTFAPRNLKLEDKSMKMDYLQNIKNYCERFWFTPNVVNLRIALMDYFRQEGIKCKLEDGHVNFDYGDYEFDAEFKVFEDYAECIIESDYEDDDYENLEVKEKALLADQVNIREVNHCLVKAYNDVVEVKTFFYFTNTKMMLKIFCDRLDELVGSLKQIDEVLTDKKNDYRAYKSRRVGFYIETEEREESEEEDDFKVAAKARK